MIRNTTRYIFFTFCCLLLTQWLSVPLAAAVSPSDVSHPSACNATDGEIKTELEAVLAAEGCLEFTTDTLRMTLEYETGAEVCVDMQVESNETPTNVEVCGSNNQQITVSTTDNDYCFNLNPSAEYFGVADPICVVHCFNDQGATICDTTIIMATVNAPEEFVCDVLIRGMFTNRATCEAANGSARVEIEGNPADFAYEWSTGATGTVEINRVTPGEYYLTVTEIATQCVVIDTFEVGNIPGPTAMLSATDTNCAGEGGLITVDMMEGSPPYKITWVGMESGIEENIEATTFNIPNLPAGNYTVEVQDIYNCSSIMEVAIAQPTNDITLVVSETNHIDCNNLVGSAAIVISGVNGDYQLALNDSILTDFTNQTQVKLSDLAAGDYKVNLVDANGCTAEIEFVITESSDLEIAADAIDLKAANCATAMDGAIRSTTETIYTIQNSAGEVIGETPLTNLAVGNYLVVYNENNCRATLEVEIVAGEELELDETAVEITDAACGATGGAIRSTTETIYTIQNNAGENVGQTPLTDLAAGTYTVIHTEGDCRASMEIEIATGDDLEFSESEIIITNISCNGENDGSIDAPAGTATFLVQNSNGEDMGMTPQTDLAAGTYRVMKSAGDCTAELEVMITEPDLLTADIDVRPESCAGNNGSIILTVTGGTGDYTYVWSDGINDSATATNLAVGEYSVTVTDAAGCANEWTGIMVTTLCEEVPCEPVFTTNQIEMESAEEVVAVCLPAGDTDLADYDFILNGENLNFTLMDCTDGQSIELANPATHELIITDADDCADTLAIILTQPLAECLANIADETINVATENCQNTVDYCLPITDLTHLEMSDNGNLLINDFASCPNGFAIPLAVGAHEIIITDTLNNCADTVNVTIEVVCEVTRDTLFLDVSVDEMKTVCPDTSQLASTHILTDLDCFDNSTGNADFATDEDDCIAVTGVTGGIDEICIIICDNTGICDTTLLIVSVNEESKEEEVDDKLVIHTGFSPNGDGINDAFTIENIERFPGSKLVVYSRWGVRVFRSDDYNNNEAWTGKFEDFLLPDGGYFYFLEVSDGRKLKGWVTLRR